MNTRARIATVCGNRQVKTTVEENREIALALLRQALEVKPDLVCLPESFTLTYALSAPDVAEPVDGPTVAAVAKLAKEANCYVICPIFTCREGRCYNSAILLDRRGQVAGIYDKRHPVTTTHDYTAVECGTMPGQGDGVFDLDFGRVAVRICFDIGYTDDWRMLGEKGVKLVFWPSAYNGGFPLQAHASANEYYVVSAVRTDSSRIINPCGTILQRTDGTEPVIWRDINLDYLVCHSDFNYGIPGRIEKAYGKRVEVRWETDEGTILVEPADPAVKTEMLKKEFGLETRREYLGRHAVAYRQLASGKKPEPQTALHGNRPMYSAG
jgi:predicted amidohydrolase